MSFIKCDPNGGINFEECDLNKEVPCDSGIQADINASEKEDEKE